MKPHTALYSPVVLFSLLWTLATCNHATCPQPDSDGTDTSSVSNPLTVNRAIQLDGVNDYVNLRLSPSVYALQTGTLSFFIKIANLSDSLVFFAIAQTGASNYSSDQWYAGFRGDAPNQKQLQVVGVKNATGHTTLDAFTPANSIANNNWHNVIIVSDNSGNDVEIYIDGILQTMTVGACCGGDTHDFFFNDAANADNAKIGVILRDAFLDYSQFTMDDFCIWNRALSTTEIQNIVTDPSTKPSSGLTVNYTFDQFEDLGIGNAGTNDIKDQVGNNHADAVNGVILVTH